MKSLFIIALFFIPLNVSAYTYEESQTIRVASELIGKIRPVSPGQQIPEDTLLLVSEIEVLITELGGFPSLNEALTLIRNELQKIKESTE